MVQQQVIIPGGVLSVLVHSICEHQQAQSGLVLGRVQEQVVDQVTDTNDCEQVRKLYIHITAVIALHGQQAIFDEQDCLREDLLEQVSDGCSNSNQQVIGLLYYKPNSHYQSLTLRDALLLQQYIQVTKNQSSPAVNQKNVPQKIMRNIFNQQQCLAMNIGRTATHADATLQINIVCQLIDIQNCLNQEQQGQASPVLRNVPFVIANLANRPPAGQPNMNASSVSIHESMHVHQQNDVQGQGYDGFLGMGGLVTDDNTEGLFKDVLKAQQAVHARVQQTWDHGNKQLRSIGNKLQVQNVAVMQLQDQVDMLQQQVRSSMMMCNE